MLRWEGRVPPQQVKPPAGRARPRRLFGKIKAVRKIVTALARALGPVVNAFVIMFAVVCVCEAARPACARGPPPAAPASPRSPAPALQSNVGD